MKTGCSVVQFDWADALKIIKEKMKRLKKEQEDFENIMFYE